MLHRRGLAPPLFLRLPSAVPGALVRIGAAQARRLILLALALGPMLGGAGRAHAQRPGVTPPPKPASAVGRAFNFTPTTREILQDGFPTPTTMFRDGDHFIRVNVPNDWKVGGSAGELHFTTPTIPGALITIRSSSLTPPENFDAPWIESTRPLLLGSLPKDGKNRRIANIAPNALNIAGWTSIEFKLAYEDLGQKTQVTDWMFLKLADGRLLEVIINGKEQNFAAIRAAEAYILAGWGVVPANLLK